MFDFSHYYYRFAEELQSSRLDVLLNDTIFDVIEERIAIARFPFVPLDEAVTYLNDSRNPQVNPYDEFIYIDIGGIDRVRGTPSPEIMLGYQATSSRIRRVMHEGNILVSTTRPTRSAICIVPNELDDQICSTGFAVLESKPDVLNRFLYYALRSDLATWQFEQLCSGSGYPAINQETDLPQVRVPKPDIEIQRQILEIIEPIETAARGLDEQAADIRDSVDTILLQELGIEKPPIDTTNYFFKTGAEKKTLWLSVFPDEVTDRMHYLFFHPRYRVLDTLCDRYQTIPLKEICREPIVRGEQPSDEDYDELGNVILLKTVDLKNEYIDYKNALKVSEDFFNAHNSAIIHKGDIIVASTGYVSMGKVDVYDSEELAMISGELLAIRVKDDYDPYFVCYFLRSYIGQMQFDKWFSGSSGQIHIYDVNLEQFVIPSSGVDGISPEEQTRIANVITEQLNDARMLELQAEAKWREAKDKFEEMIFVEYSHASN